MSGGRYNYLCFEQFPELIERTKDMNEIQFRLRQLGADGIVTANDAANEVAALIDYCEQARQTIEPLFERLRDIFHAIEWLDSGDIGKDDIKEEFKKYRDEKQSH